MKFRKLFVMSTVLACGLTLAACGNNGNSDSNSTPANNSQGGTTTTASVSVGLGYSAKFELGEDDPTTGQLDLTAAMVAFDANGKIVDARIDVVQVKVKSTEAGNGLELTNTNIVDGSVTTKLELGKNYGMLNNPYGSTLAEVDVQIEDFCDWTKGQTVAEVKAKIDPTKGHGTAHHEDLEGMVTITCTDFVSAMELAYANKSTATYAVEDFTTGIAMVSGLAYNYGNPQVDISVDLAGTIVSEGKVVAALVDAVVFQTTVTEGAIAAKNDKYVVDGKLTSKKLLGDAYAMAERNDGQEGCELEWYEQAEIIELAAAGKTSVEIATLVKDTGDLAGATITLDGYVTAMSKAAKYADMDYVGPQWEQAE